MAFCPNCGTQVTGGRFCPNCGADVSAASAAGSAGSRPNAGTGYVPPAGSLQAPGLTDNVASALCYLGWIVTGVIFLFLSPYNRNRTIRFHAFQSIFTFLGFMVVWIVLDLALFNMLHMWSLALTLRRLFDLFILVLWLYMMYTAYNNRKIKLPVVGDLAEKQA